MSFCNKEDGKRGREEEDKVKDIQRAREGRAKGAARLRRKVAVDWIGEDFHPRPAVGCGRCFRAGEYCRTPSNDPTSALVYYLGE